MQVQGRIVGVVYLLLVCYSLIVQDLRSAFVPAAVTILGFCIGGLIVFHRVRGSFEISWPAATPDSGQVFMVIAGTPLPFLGYDQVLIINFRLRRVAELAVLAALSAVTLAIVSLGRVSAEPLIHGWSLFYLELVCMAVASFLLLSARWFNERIFLSRSRISFAEILSRDPGLLRAGITYQFFDDSSNRRGGHGPIVSNDDNASLVFYDAKNPDINCPFSAFRFHKFTVNLVPRPLRSVPQS